MLENLENLMKLSKILRMSDRTEFLETTPEKLDIIFGNRIFCNRNILKNLENYFKVLS